MTANEIIKNLWVGNRDDARAWPDPKMTLCVLEVKKQGPTLPTQHWVPILDYDTPRPVEGCAKAEALDRAAAVIHEQLPKGPFLVHCGIGFERSPLTVAWYLVTHRKDEFPTLSAAYAFMQPKRPIIQDRQHWLDRQPQ